MAKKVERRKTAERRLNLKEALLDAAERTMEREGLGALRARDLANEVGCAVGAIYNVFPDLDALVLAVNARTLAAFGQLLEPGGPGKRTPPDSDPPIARLVQLAMAYLNFASTYGLRWRALFEHRMSGDREVPEWYIEAQSALFLLVEEPLRELCPRLRADQRRLLARNIFAAVHGIVSLGLDRKLVSLPLSVLRSQVTEIVTAIGSGLARDKDRMKSRSSGSRTRKTRAPSS
jgi:AcrR family transcriptional regulator